MDWKKSAMTDIWCREYCLPVVKNHRIAGIEEVDNATKMSLTYMKDLLKERKPALQKSRSSCVMVTLTYISVNKYTARIA